MGCWVGVTVAVGVGWGVGEIIGVGVKAKMDMIPSGEILICKVSDWVAEALLAVISIPPADSIR